MSVLSTGRSITLLGLCFCFGTGGLQSLATYACRRVPDRKTEAARRWIFMPMAFGIQANLALL